MIAFREERHDPPAGARAGPQPLYAIGDVHGCYDLLHAMLARIGSDAAERYPGVTPRLILCGDYVDRGPDSAKVLAALTWLTRSSAIEVTLLEGNHEAMLMRFLEQPAEHGRWLVHGGAETLRSYGITVPEDVTAPLTLTGLRDSLLDAMPASHYTLLRTLSLIAEAGDYAFVHAGVAPGVSLRAQTRDDVLWIRGEFLDHAKPSTSIVVHGHSWADDRAIVLPHRIGIDTGAYDTGVLTAVHIADDRLDILQAVRSNERTA